MINNSVCDIHISDWAAICYKLSLSTEFARLCKSISEMDHHLSPKYFWIVVFAGVNLGFSFNPA